MMNSTNFFGPLAMFPIRLLMAALPERASVRRCDPEYARYEQEPPIPSYAAYGHRAWGYEMDYLRSSHNDISRMDF